MNAYLQAFLKNVYIKPQNFIGRVLVLLGLRRHWLYWGTVYDAVSKQPLDPVIVKLIHVPSGQVVGSCITDMRGRYGFIGWPGKFKILARKANYEFPSRLAQGDSDGIYGNLYHGDFFEVVGGTEVISFNIPMDPVSRDWNQEAKKDMIKFHPYLNYLLHSLVIVVFWAVFAFGGIYGYFRGSSAAFVILGLYAAIFLLAFLVPRPRLWGKVLCKNLTEDAAEIVLEIKHERIQSVVVAKTRVFEDGKFFLRVAKGRYVLDIKAYNPQGQEILSKTKKVSIGSGGVLNDYFVL